MVEAPGKEMQPLSANIHIARDTVGRSTGGGESALVAKNPFFALVRSVARVLPLFSPPAIFGP